MPPPFGFRSVAAATALSGIAKLGVALPGAAAGAAATHQEASSSGDGTGSGNGVGSIVGTGDAGGNVSGALGGPPDSSQPRDGLLGIAAASAAGGSAAAAPAAVGGPVGQAVRVLAAALAAGVDDLNASQLAQACLPPQLLALSALTALSET